MINPWDSVTLAVKSMHEFVVVSLAMSLKSIAVVLQESFNTVNTLFMASVLGPWSILVGVTPYRIAAPANE